MAADDEEGWRKQEDGTSSAEVSGSCGFLDALHRTEDYLGQYYDLSLPLRAADFILEEKAFSDLTSRKAPSRGEVCLVCEENVSGSGEDAYLGIFFSEDIRQKLTEISPFLSLNRRNIDAFCVLVEELSHFHLICQRSARRREVSRLELEWQAEVDKVLLSALLLREQLGTWHIDDLTNLLFDQALVDPTPPYPEAHKQAEKFWRHAIRKGVGERISPVASDFHRFMLHNYHRPIQEKAPFSQGALYRPSEGRLKRS